jgi:hypothetical protein
MTARACALYLGKLLADRATVSARGRFVRVTPLDAPPGVRPETLSPGIADQAREVVVVDGLRVTCPCGRRAPLYLAYLCFFCGLYLCRRCAERHFSSHPLPGGDAPAHDQTAGPALAGVDVRLATASTDGGAYAPASAGRGTPDGSGGALVEEPAAYAAPGFQVGVPALQPACDRLALGPVDSDSLKSRQQAPGSPSPENPRLAGRSVSAFRRHLGHARSGPAAESLSESTSLASPLARVNRLRELLQEIYRRANNALADGAAPALVPLAEVVRFRADEALVELGDLEVDLRELAEKGTTCRPGWGWRVDPQ